MRAVCESCDVVETLTSIASGRINVDKAQKYSIHWRYHPWLELWVQRQFPCQSCDVSLLPTFQYRLVRSCRSLAVGSGCLCSTKRQWKCLLHCLVSSNCTPPSLIWIKCGSVVYAYPYLFVVCILYSVCILSVYCLYTVCILSVYCLYTLCILSILSVNAWMQLRMQSWCNVQWSCYWYC